MGGDRPGRRPGSGRADGLTPSGVPLLWPSRRRFTLNLCSTGSWIEFALVAVWWCSPSCCCFRSCPRPCWAAPGGAD
ncbi:hypothetical protein MTBLM5_50185 [Magnetospirillum sp. LM-5]|nr:hypothetical protein MTBLM5_50185 [Magnetospirillum sp. LM-5]